MISCGYDRPNRRAASTSFESMPRMPLYRVKYIGKVVANAISAILVNSPMPNHRINSGTRPRNGRVRAICMGESTATSPRRDRPATSASAVPSDSETARPISTRRSDTTTLLPISPETISSNMVPSICDGAASTRSGSTPVRAAISHAASKISGLMARSRTADRKGRLRVAAMGACCGGLLAVVETDIWLPCSEVAAGVIQRRQIQYREQMIMTKLIVYSIDI